jgi:hypothetical protein
VSGYLILAAWCGVALVAQYIVEAGSLGRTLAPQPRRRSKRRSR